MSTKKKYWMNIYWNYQTGQIWTGSAWESANRASRAKGGAPQDRFLGVVQMTADETLGFADSEWAVARSFS
jgi:hypothetical protein